MNKARKRSPAQLLVEKNFSDSLDRLFNIAPQNALQILNSPQKRILIDSRHICKTGQLLKNATDVQEVLSTATICLDNNLNVVQVESTETNSDINEIDLAGILDRCFFVLFL